MTGTAPASSTTGPEVYAQTTGTPPDAPQEAATPASTGEPALPSSLTLVPSPPYVVNDPPAVVPTITRVPSQPYVVNNPPGVPTITIVPSPPYVVNTDPSPTTAKIRQVMLAQSLVYPSDDPELELVGHRDVMVLVKVTNENRQEPGPAGMLQIVGDDNTVLETIPLKAPESIPEQVPTSPSFATAYSANIPGLYVRPGMKFTVSLAHNQVTQSVAPRVGLDVVMDVVAVPIQIDQLVGEVLPDFGKAIELRMPFTKVNAYVHAAHRPNFGNWRPVTPDDWRVALQTIWGEMDALMRAENPARVGEYGHRLHYIAFVPNNSTQEGESMRPPIGKSSAIMDFPASPATVTKSLIQEMGHHFFLDHAPCGQAGDVDAAYPYANAALGNEARAIWGYRADTATFIDPRDTQRHDVMANCAGDTFSDYNYRKIQRVLAPGGLFGPTRETVGNAH